MKILYFIKNRMFLKYALVFLSLSLAGTILLYLSYRTEKNAIKKEKDNAKEIKKLIDKADLYYDEDKRDLALLLFNKAIKLCNPEVNSTDYVYALYCIAEIYNINSDFISSEMAATKALPYLKLVKNPRYAWLLYNVQGITYQNTYNFNDAELYFKKALRLKTSLWRKRIALNNIGAVYKDRHQYKKAIEIYEILASHVHNSKHKNLDLSNYAFILDNMGYCYFQTGNYKKALKCYNKGLEIRLNPETSEGIVNSYRHLSSYFEKRNPGLAKKYAMESLKAATKMKSVQETILCLNVLIKCSEGSDLKKYSERYIHLTDSLAKASKTNKNGFAIVKYESKADKDENLKLKAEKAENDLQLERHKTHNIISYIIITFAFGILLSLPLYMSIKGKKEQKNAVFESEIKISNKLRNELTQETQNALLFAQSEDLENSENKNQLLTNLDKIYSQTRNISRENSSIVTNEKYSIGLKEIMSGFKTPHLNLLINGLDDINWNRINKIKKIILYRVLQELLLYMKNDNEVSLAAISFKIIEKNITVTYSNNRPKTQNERKILKNDLQNVENRIKTINGTINFDHYTENGFKIIITFPQ